MIVLNDAQAAAFLGLAAALTQALRASDDAQPTTDSPQLAAQDAVDWVLRESAAAGALAAALPTPVPLEPGFLATLVIREDAWEVSHDGRTLSLTLLQYRLLRQLVATWGHSVPVSRLAEAMFGVPFADHQRVVAHVKRLRRRLAEQGVLTCRIETVRGIGFRIVSIADALAAGPPRPHSSTALVAGD